MSDNSTIFVYLFYSTCELERIDLHETHTPSSRRVLVGLLLQFLRDLSEKYNSTLRKCMDVLYVGNDE